MDNSEHGIPYSEANPKAQTLPDYSKRDPNVALGVTGVNRIETRHEVSFNVLCHLHRYMRIFDTGGESM